MRVEVESWEQTVCVGVTTGPPDAKKKPLNFKGFFFFVFLGMQFGMPFALKPFGIDAVSTQCLAKLALNSYTINRRLSLQSPVFFAL